MKHLIKKTSTFNQACEAYKTSISFSKLKARTQKDYIYNFTKACNNIGTIKLKSLKYRDVSDAYDYWLSTFGVRSSNYIASCVSIVLNYSIKHEAIQHNPMSLVDKTKTKPRRVMWTFDQVKLFLDTAYSDFKWRSIGLIFHMAYDWAQRVGDMRKLTWDSLDLDAQRADLTQSKTGVLVKVPINDKLTKMLRTQKEEYDGLSEYVAPRTKPRAGRYSQYDENEISILVNEIKDKVNLPKDLHARDLRRTGITEMVEMGVDLAGIMQVSGHQSPQSANPYLVNTFSGASKSLERRHKNGNKY